MGINAPITRTTAPNTKTAPNTRDNIKSPFPEKVNSTTETITVTLNPDEWILLQNSPLSSVPVQDDKHTIVEGYEKHVNHNKQTFSTDNVEKYYETFNGGFVFKNHDDDPRRSYGIILGVHLRKIKGKSGAIRVIPELLMAINIKLSDDKQLIKKIQETGEVKTSMGMYASGLMCSMCGNIATDDNPECSHISFNEGKSYITEYGYQSIVCSVVSESSSPDGSVRKYNEEDYDEYPITWYENSILSATPAYDGVVNSYKYTIPKESLIDNKLVIEMPKRAYTRTGIDGVNALKYYERQGVISVKEN